MSEGHAELTPRQREILRWVVEEYVASSQPVGSKTLVARSGLKASPSTVRAELAELEARGLLTHPHTSAGRVPTERGYRCYVDTPLQRGGARPRPPRPAASRRSGATAATSTRCSSGASHAPRSSRST